MVGRGICGIFGGTCGISIETEFILHPSASQTPFSPREDCFGTVKTVPYGLQWIFQKYHRGEPMCSPVFGLDRVYPSSAFFGKAEKSTFPSGKAKKSTLAGAFLFFYKSLSISVFICSKTSSMVPVESIIAMLSRSLSISKTIP